MPGIPSNHFKVQSDCNSIVTSCLILAITATRSGEQVTEILKRVFIIFQPLKVLSFTRYPRGLQVTRLPSHGKSVNSHLILMGRETITNVTSHWELTFSLH